MDKDPGHGPAEARPSLCPPDSSLVTDCGALGSALRQAQARSLRTGWVTRPFLPGTLQRGQGCGGLSQKCPRGWGISPTSLTPLGFIFLISPHVA